MSELAQPILSMPMFLILGFISLMLIGLLAEHIERTQDKKLVSITTMTLTSIVKTHTLIIIKKLVNIK